MLVTGERALDIAYRIHVEGISSEIFETFGEAIAAVNSKDVSVLSAYTAFFELVM